jgi:hypothetical protein
MENPISEDEKKIKIESNENENNSLDNNKENNEKNNKYKVLNEKIIDIINKINENFDFKTYEKEKFNSIEKVINNHIILFINYIVFSHIRLIFNR